MGWGAGEEASSAAAPSHLSDPEGAGLRPGLGGASLELGGASPEGRSLPVAPLPPGSWEGVPCSRQGWVACASGLTPTPGPCGFASSAGAGAAPGQRGGPSAEGPRAGGPSSGRPRPLTPSRQDAGQGHVGLGEQEDEHQVHHGACEAGDARGLGQGPSEPVPGVGPSLPSPTGAAADAHPGHQEGAVRPGHQHGRNGAVQDDRHQAHDHHSHLRGPRREPCAAGHSPPCRPGCALRLFWWVAGGQGGGAGVAGATWNHTVDDIWVSRGHWRCS